MGVDGQKNNSMEQLEWLEALTHADVNFCAKLAMKVDRESTEVIPNCADLS